ncbi:unnamed protein product [Arctogadus glacialis]
MQQSSVEPETPPEMRVTRCPLRSAGARTQGQRQRQVLQLQRDVKAFDQDSRMAAYGTRVKDLVHHEVGRVQQTRCEFNREEHIPLISRRDPNAGRPDSSFRFHRTSPWSTQPVIILVYSPDTSLSVAMYVHLSL